MKATKVIGVLLLVFFLAAFSAPACADPLKELATFQKDDRVLILAPHPDDETIGCAGVIMRAREAGAKVKVVYLTSGDNNIFSILFYNPLLFPVRVFFIRGKDFVTLGQQRQAEAIEAMKILGLEKEDLTFLGYPDHGTDKMFISYWGDKKPYESMLSRQKKVPYKDSLSFKEEYKGDNILADLKGFILDYRPTKVFVSHAADFNGDHWALYLYLQMVLADLFDEMPMPKVYSYLVHVPGWPLPRHHHPELELKPPSEDFFSDLSTEITWEQLKLSPDEVEKKFKAMLAYRSQTHISAFYLFSFIRRNELFSELPVIKLKKQAGKNYNFTGDNQWVSFALVENYLLLKAKKPPESKSRSSFIFFLAGYKYGMFFGDMPHISIHTKFDKFKIYDTISGKPIEPKDASLAFGPEAITLKIPLGLLGNPDAFLFSLHSYNSRFLPGGCSAFRRVVIEP